VFATGGFLRVERVPDLSLMALRAGRIHDTECCRRLASRELLVEDRIEYVRCESSDRYAPFRIRFTYIRRTAFMRVW
jgi:hypothetical protein